MIHTKLIDQSIVSVLNPFPTDRRAFNMHMRIPSIAQSMIPGPFLELGEVLTHVCRSSIRSCGSRLRIPFPVDGTDIRRASQGLPERIDAMFCEGRSVRIGRLVCGDWEGKTETHPYAPWLVIVHFVSGYRADDTCWDRGVFGCGSEFISLPPVVILRFSSAYKAMQLMKYI
jgi:hypothetical protein